MVDIKLAEGEIDILLVLCTLEMYPDLGCFDRTLTADIKYREKMFTIIAKLRATMLQWRDQDGRH